MGKSRRRRAEALFQQAADLAPEERAAFLEEHTGRDPELRGEVEGLLEFLSDTQIPALEAVEQDDRPELIGQRIGPYEVLELIGEGGFGSVYLAEQEVPIRRRVALKILKLGMDTRQIILRFEAERQALALMEHPNIAKVLDAGSTDTGRPYFVMEMVRGVPITTFCDEQGLAVPIRLRLFIQVCRAVQHAHQKGIIHRDIKPNNVLVTTLDGMAVPKVIDFGIAKAVERRLTEGTCATDSHLPSFMGTPEYMSPEQAEPGGQDVDTRTDIYSLGALLYELLTGRVPFNGESLRQSGYAEIQRIIREQAPPTPSRRITRLGDHLDRVARFRNVAPPALSRIVRGDLDWIVMKALEKDRNRRYDTAASLARDVERHLMNEPVLAGPPGAWYRLEKFVRRHRLGVVTSLVVTVAVLAGLALAVTGLLQATRARAALKVEKDTAEVNATTAKREADKARAVTTFLRDMLARARPPRTGNRDVSLRFVLDEAAERIDAEAFASQPEVEADVRLALYAAYRRLGLDGPAATHLARAVALKRRMRGGDSEETLRLSNHLSATLMRQGRFAEAEARVSETVERARRVVGAEHQLTLAAMNLEATLFWMVGRTREAEARHRALLAHHRRTLGEEHHRTQVTMNTLAIQLGRLGRLDEAEALHREVLDIQRRLLGDEHLETLKTSVNLADLLMQQGKLRTAERMLRRVVRTEREVLGDENHLTLQATHNLAIVLCHEGEEDQGEDLLLHVLEVQRRTQSPHHPDARRTFNNLLDLYRRQGRFAKLRSALEEMIALCRQSMEEAGTDPDALERYAEAMLRCEFQDLCDPEEALAAVERAARLTSRTDPKILSTLAIAYQRNHRLEDAVQAQMRAIVLGPTPPARRFSPWEQDLITMWWQKDGLMGALEAYGWLLLTRRSSATSDRDRRHQP
jgi:serine/threonine protein kinase/tetratricopeptide (TPR) repeat protein